MHTVHAHMQTWTTMIAGLKGCMVLQNFIGSQNQNKTKCTYGSGRCMQRSAHGLSRFGLTCRLNSGIVLERPSSASEPTLTKPWPHLTKNTIGVRVLRCYDTTHLWDKPIVIQICPSSRLCKPPPKGPDEAKSPC